MPPSSSRTAGSSTGASPRTSRTLPVTTFNPATRRRVHAAARTGRAPPTGARPDRTRRSAARPRSPCRAVGGTRERHLARRHARRSFRHGHDDSPRGSFARDHRQLPATSQPPSPCARALVILGPLLARGCRPCPIGASRRRFRRNSAAQLGPERCIEIVRTTSPKATTSSTAFHPAGFELPEATLQDAAELLSEVPVLDAMRMLSVLTGAAHRARTEQDGQRRLRPCSTRSCGTPKDKVLAFLNGTNRPRARSAPITVLQRFVVLTPPTVTRSGDATISSGLVGALLAIAGALPCREFADARRRGSLKTGPDALPDAGRELRRTPCIAEARAHSWSRYVTVAAVLGAPRGGLPI